MKIKDFIIKHKIPSIAVCSVLALGIAAGTVFGIVNHKDSIKTKEDSTFSAKGSFGETTGNPDAEDAKKNNESETSSTESTSVVSDASQAESQASDPAVTQTPADTKQNSSTATSSKKTTPAKKSSTSAPAASTPSTSTPSTAPTQPTTPAQPSQPSGGSGSTGGSTIDDGTKMGRAIAEGIDTSDINLPKDEQGRFICPHCGRPSGDGENGTCMRVVVGYNPDWSSIYECRHYS